MCTRQQCIDKLSDATPVLKHKFGVKSLCLFGSMARGDYNENSDIDIFVEMPPKAFQIVALKDFLQNLLSCSVDLIRKHKNLNPFLIKEIQKDGIIIFSPTQPA